MTVPDDQQSVVDDTPAEYRVVVIDDGPVACMIYGRYGNRWVANAKTRWLVRHLIEEIEKLRKETNQRR